MTLELKDHERINDSILYVDTIFLADKEQTIVAHKHKVQLSSHTYPVDYNHNSVVSD